MQTAGTQVCHKNSLLLFWVNLVGFQIMQKRKDLLGVHIVASVEAKQN